MKYGQERVTIDDLAVVVKRGFNAVDKLFDGVDDRLDRIEQVGWASFGIEGAPCAGAF
jgi:hypothetical protein